MEKHNPQPESPHQRQGFSNVNCDVSIQTLPQSIEIRLRSPRAICTSVRKTRSTPRKAGTGAYLTVTQMEREERALTLVAAIQNLLLRWRGFILVTLGPA